MLTQIAHYLKTSLRDSDKVARFGGDEFLILLASTGPEEAFCIAERLRVGIEQSHLPCDCTVSMGVASLDPSSGCANLDELFEHADQALYLSKTSGRNRVSVYS